MTQAAGWGEALHGRIAQTLKNARRQAGMSAQQLADETKHLGHAISRSEIANYESGRKRGLDVADLMMLAAALRVPPVTLLFSTPDEVIEKLPGQRDTSLVAMAWFAGDRELAWPGTDFDSEQAQERVNETVVNPDSAGAHLLDLVRQRAQKRSEIHIARAALGVLDQDSVEFGRALEYIGTLRANIRTINDVIHAAVAEMKGESE